MSKLGSIVAAVVLGFSFSAFAQEGPPKPAPELDQYKMMVGTWKCQGKANMGGKEFKTTGTYKAAWAQGGFWLVANFEGKAEGMPGKHTGMDIYGYDAGSKMYTMSSFDSMGGSATMTSKGWEGDKEEWSGKGTMMGKSGDMKQTVTKKGDKEVALNGTDGSGGSWEATCKK